MVPARGLAQQRRNAENRLLSKLRSAHAIDHAGWFKPGITILIMAVGAGMAWGVGIIRW
jgi:hypothetical protein